MKQFLLTLRFLLGVAIVWPVFWYTLGVQTLRRWIMRRFSGAWTLPVVAFLIRIQPARETLQAINEWTARDHR